MSDSSASPADVSNRKPRNLWRYATIVALLFGVGAFGWTLIARATTFRIYTIPTGSMGPTIKSGDRVAVELDRSSRPNRGELWVFEMPPTGLGPANQGLKRVIGLPGESIEVSGGKVLINGEPLDEPYLSAPMTYTMPPRKLTDAEYFMMGDMRNASADSHVFGPVPKGRLTGRVRYRVWPLDRAGGL